MDLIFNELSLHNKVEDIYLAQNLMTNLVKLVRTYKRCFKDYGLEPPRLMVPNGFWLLYLTSNYTIQDWLNDTTTDKKHGTYKTFLLGITRRPYINEEDEVIEHKFISNYYYLNEQEIPELENRGVEGLAVAFIYNTLVISFNTHNLWTKTQISLKEITDTSENIVSVRHISSEEHINAHQSWLEDSRPIELQETNIPNVNKEIRLRDDHGKNKLLEFSKKIVMSPYVIKIINSLPFNPHKNNFIKDIKPNGQIEIVLIKTDEGLGISIQTTGRNLQETKKIAEILKAQFT